jgi:hypothetical protein
MNVAFVVEEHPDKWLVRTAPWVVHREQLAEAGITVELFDDLRSAWRPFDAMILMVWLDLLNPVLFKPYRIIPVMEKFSAYRGAFPETTQIILNHTDMGRRAYAAPYWRMGDPILFRTPAYDRSELAPFPADQISLSIISGVKCFRCLRSNTRPVLSEPPPGRRAIGAKWQPQLPLSVSADVFLR